MALAERTWERVGERKRDRARLNESAAKLHIIYIVLSVNARLECVKMLRACTETTHILVQEGVTKRLSTSSVQ